MSTAADGHRFGWTDVLLLATVLIWGVNFSVVKAALAFLPPLAFNAVRFAVASVALLVLVRAAGYPLRFARRDLPFLIGLGVLGNTLYQALFVYGAALTTADNASLMLSTAPAWVALFGTVAGTDRLAGRGWLGITMALFGVATIVLAGGRETAFRFGAASLGGDLLVLGATLCWALYTLLIRHAVGRYPALSVTALATAAGSLPLVLAGTPDLIGVVRTGTAPTWTFGAAALSGLFAIAVAYVLWNLGIARLGSARTALYNNLVLPVAVLTAWLALGETLTLLQILGIATAVAGVTLARRHVRPVGP